MTTEPETEEGEDPNQLRLNLGIGVYPMITTNFVTAEDGSNTVVTEVQSLIHQIMEETIGKINQAVTIFLMMQGIKLNNMKPDELKKHIKFTVNSDQAEGTTVVGVYHQDTGEHSTDDDLLKHIISGRSSDN